MHQNKKFEHNALLKDLPIIADSHSDYRLFIFFQPPQTSLSEITNIDKLVHFCMYGGLTTVLWVEYLLRHKSITYSHLIIGGVLAPICMSGIIEILQSTTDNRSGDWMDFLANITGVCAASLLCYYVIRPYLKRKASENRK